MLATVETVNLTRRLECQVAFCPEGAYGRTWMHCIHAVLHTGVWGRCNCKECDCRITLLL